MKLSTSDNVVAVVSTVLNLIPKSHKHRFFTSFTGGEMHDLAGNKSTNADLKRDLQKELDLLFLQIKNHPLYRTVAKILPSCEDSCENEIHSSSYQGNQLATLFLLSIPRVVLGGFPDWATGVVLDWQDPKLLSDLNVLNEEVLRMRQAWTTSVSSHCHGHMCCNAQSVSGAS